MRKRKTFQLRIIILCMAGVIFLAFGMNRLASRSIGVTHAHAIKIDNTDYSKGSGKPVRVLWTKKKKS